MAAYVTVRLEVFDPKLELVVGVTGVPLRHPPPHHQINCLTTQYIYG